MPDVNEDVRSEGADDSADDDSVTEVDETRTAEALATTKVHAEEDAGKKETDLTFDRFGALVVTIGALDNFLCAASEPTLGPEVAAKIWLLPITFTGVGDADADETSN